MGIITGLLRKILKLILYVLFFSSIVLVIPNLPPYTQFTKLQPEPTLPRTGALAPNEALNNPGKLFEGKILGPEAFDVHNGEVYTGLATGEIVKLSPAGHVTFVTKLGRPCTGLQQEHICGRPLGLQIDKKTNQLYVADAYHGVWKVDLKTDKKQLLVSPNVEINGKKPKLINDIALDSNGDLFWTDSSADFPLKDGSHTMLLDPSGRLFHYNAAKNVSTVVADKLGFPNGVVISPDRQFVLVAETTSYKITKIYISGPKKGKSEVFVAGLPGTPDNMRALPDGSGVLVALYTVFGDDHPLIAKTLQPLPLLRKFLIRTVLMVENTFDFLNTQVPHPILEDIVYKLGSFESVAGMVSGVSGLVQIDWNGNIVASYFSTDGRTPALSDAIVVNDKLWTGAPHGQDYIAAFPAPPLLKKAFASAKVEEKPQVQKVELPKATPPTPKATQPPPQQKPAPTKPVENKPEKKPAQQTTPPPQKPAPTKPVETKQEKKPAQQTTQPPPQQKPAQRAPPPAQQKAAPTEKPKPAETKQAEKKPAPQPKQPAKPADAPVKPKDTKPTQQAVPEAAKPAEKTQAKDQQKTTPPPKTETKQPPKADKQIPVREEIPSDTAKPSNDKLKVIKKSGPDVIPNPNV
ncbi:adipocyte plasma membrane-associated protein [Aricia agestis]|uniref:adipocyte plasma membrane-associated protein n=1 Tax=Aricia agestis TaxID=91739 RepID=UPI001C20AD16|nr:adipocyte plasma membrane-associated protein [Aricia agestis]